MSLSFGLKVRTVVKPSHVVRDLGDLLSRPRRLAGKVPLVHSPPRRLLPTRCRQAQLELGLSIRYGSSRMTPMQHTLKLTALPKLSALPKRPCRPRGETPPGGNVSPCQLRAPQGAKLAASQRGEFTGQAYRTRHAKWPLPASTTVGRHARPPNDHKLRHSCY